MGAALDSTRDFAHTYIRALVAATPADVRDAIWLAVQERRIAEQCSDRRTGMTPTDPATMEPLAILRLALSQFADAHEQGCAFDRTDGGSCTACTKIAMAGELLRTGLGYAHVKDLLRRLRDAEEIRGGIMSPRNTRERMAHPDERRVRMLDLAIHIRALRNQLASLPASEDAAALEVLRERDELRAEVAMLRSALAVQPGEEAATGERP